MALDMETIRTAAERVARSRQLDVVNIEFLGAGRFRTLRVFIEKNAEERARLAKSAAESTSESASDALPSGVAVERLSGVSHEDCSGFAQDFGTLLDVEDLVPGAGYTLEVSSPGLDRALTTPEDFTRFLGCLVKLRTFTPIQNNRLWQGRLTRFADGVLTMEPTARKAAAKRKGKAKRPEEAAAVEIPLANVEKANLVVEF